MVFLVSIYSMLGFEQPRYVTLPPLLEIEQSITLSGGSATAYRRFIPCSLSRWVGISPILSIGFL